MEDWRAVRTNGVMMRLWGFKQGYAMAYDVVVLTNLRYIECIC